MSEAIRNDDVKFVLAMKNGKNETVINKIKILAMLKQKYPESYDVKLRIFKYL